MHPRGRIVTYFGFEYCTGSDFLKILILIVISGILSITDYTSGFFICQKEYKTIGGV